MAKQMAWADERGNSYAASYWNIMAVAISPMEKEVQIIFRGYRNDAARQAKKEPVGIFRLSVPASKFDDYFSLAQIEGTGKNALKQCYAYATAEDSFFSGASDV